MKNTIFYVSIKFYKAYIFGTLSLKVLTMQTINKNNYIFSKNIAFV